MYVIFGSLTTITDTIPATDDRLFPADRCTWEQSTDPDGGYTIGSVRYIGHTSTGTIAGPGGVGNPQLGYVGKSGRFVPISN